MELHAIIGCGKSFDTLKVVLCSPQKQSRNLIPSTNMFSGKLYTPCGTTRYAGQYVFESLRANAGPLPLESLFKLPKVIGGFFLSSSSSIISKSF